MPLVEEEEEEEEERRRMEEEEDVASSQPLLLQCNDTLRSELHCDDTEKRSERSEAVKKHVRTRITENNSLLLPQTEPEDTSTPGPPPPPPDPPPPPRRITGQHHPEGQVEADGGRKSTAVRFLLPSEAAPPLTPASSQDDQARDQKLYPASSQDDQARDQRPTPAP
ncbi:hypothetical protein CRUP_034639, partial [Coryphaenoides rupestris]